MSTHDADAIKTALAERGVKYALASYVDIHGACKAKCVPLSHLGEMLEGSELFTGAALDGVPQAVNDDEVAALPDPASAMVLPWNPEIAWFASDLYLGDEPFAACCRSLFKNVLAQAEAMGYRFNFGIEPEFFLLRRDESGKLLPYGARDYLAKPAYDLRTTLDSFPLLEKIVNALNGLDYDVYSYDHEDGNGQFEIDFMYTDGLTMADRYTFFRLLVGELAHRDGALASFMPKPFSDRAGSGAHYNMSLADLASGENLFASDSDPRGCGLSELGYQFVGGILRHLPALSAVVAPTVKSYKRLIKTGSMSGFTWAPVFTSFGNNNRTNAVRIPLGGGRVELRAADSANNPYLGGALTLAAGLEGVRERLDPGAPNTDNLYLVSDAELRERGIERLPRTLLDAIDAFAVDPLSKQVFGELMFDAFVDFKRAEWDSYHNHVSRWERDRYLKFY